MYTYIFFNSNKCLNIFIGQSFLRLKFRSLFFFFEHSLSELFLWFLTWTFDTNAIPYVDYGNRPWQSARNHTSRLKSTLKARVRFRLRAFRSRSFLCFEPQIFSTSPNARITFVRGVSPRS